jgi:hypothetical protein
MPRAKKTEAAVEVKAAAPVEEKKAAKKAPAKKDAAKKPAAKKAAAPKAAAEERKVVIQYNGGEIAGTDLVDKAKADAGIKTAKSVVVYVRPEINKVYYVIDDNTFGNFDLF